IAPKEPHKHGPTGLDGRREQTAAAKQEASRGILDRERVAVDAIAGAELPFEIGAPNRIGLIERGSWPTGVKATARGTPAAGASMPLENAVDRGDRGDELAGHALGQEPAHLPRELVPTVATVHRILERHGR